MVGVRRVTDDASPRSAPSDYGGILRGGVRRDGGKIFGLVTLLEEHGEAIEFDLQERWNLPLTALITGELSWRKFGAFVNQLPRESALGRSQLGEGAYWSVTDYLLALIADHLAAANWQRGSGKQSKYPTRVPRPGDKPDENEQTLGQSEARPLAEIDEFFANVHKEGGANGD